MPALDGQVLPSCILRVGMRLLRSDCCDGADVEAHCIRLNSAGVVRTSAAERPKDKWVYLSAKSHPTGRSNRLSRASPTSWLLLSSLGNNINVVLRPWLGCAHTAGRKSHSQENRFSFHDNSPSRSLLEGQEPPQSLLKTICKVLTCLLVHFIA